MLPATAQLFMVFKERGGLRTSNLRVDMAGRVHVRWASGLAGVRRVGSG